jgi:hypothetical protein
VKCVLLVWENNKLNVSENKVKLSLCSLFNWAQGHEGVMGEWKYSSTNFFYLDSRWRWVVSFTHRPLYPQGKSPHRKIFRPKRTKRARNLWCYTISNEICSDHVVLLRKRVWKRSLWRSKRKCQDNIKMDLREICCKDWRWMELVHHCVYWLVSVFVVLNLRVQPRQYLLASKCSFLDD